MTNGTFRQLGETFWAKVGTHPWWPCMIFYSPDGDKFVRESPLYYHVQFFGPLEERAWVSANNLIEYQGLSELQKTLQKLSASAPKMVKSKYDLKVRDNLKKPWDLSVGEADDALKLSLDERVDKYGRLSREVRRAYIPNHQRDEMIAMMKHVPLTPDEEHLALTNFLVDQYDSLAERTPDTIDTEALENDLREQWTLFDIATKRSYLSDPLAVFVLNKLKKADKPCARTSMRPKSASILAAREDAGAKKTKKTATKATASVKKAECDVEIHRLVVSPAQFRLQPVCHICEVYNSNPGLMYTCTGKCGRSFHPKCIVYKTDPPASALSPETFMCNECITQCYTCRLCHEAATKDNALLECKTSGCGRFFHESCIKREVCAEYSGCGSTFVLKRCPAHICNTCYCERAQAGSDWGAKQPLESLRNADETNFVKGPFLECVRCAAAFHTSDLCTPAGSVEVSLSNIVCPKHFVGTLAQTPAFKTEKSPFCTICFQGGNDRLHCLTCPITYHPKCLGQLNKEAYRLEDKELRCPRVNIQPRYGQIVWAKIPSFRWWPCEVIHARNAPINILNLARPEGAFPIHFLASDEYQWICRSRVYPYEIGLKYKPNLAPGSSRFEKAFAKSKNAAPRVHVLYVNHVWRRGLPMYSDSVEVMPEKELMPVESPVRNVSNDRTSGRSPSAAQTHFRDIQCNEYTEDALAHVAEAEAEPSKKCVCFTDGTQCTARADCENVKQRCECSPENCSAGKEACVNRLFTESREKPSSRVQLQVFRTINRGFGLRVAEEVDEGSFVLEFLGQVVTLAEANERLARALASKENEARSPENCEGEASIMKLTGALAIDASSCGNNARFINHSCDPNLQAACWSVHGRPCMGLFACRAIEKDEELTVNYKSCTWLCSTLLAHRSNICLCGADNCYSMLKFPHSFSLDQGKQSYGHKEVDQKQDDLSDHEVPERGMSTLSRVLQSSVKQEAKPLMATVPSPQSVPPLRLKKAAKRAVDSHYVVEEENGVHEDFCYRCGDGGELMLCDKATCLKAYHLHCLGLTKPPLGVWYCPWHYCDDCGRPAARMCWRCPNAYCTDHGKNEDVIQVDPLDAERWAASQSVLAKIEKSEEDSAAAAVNEFFMTFRWICRDHNHLRILGSEKRPYVSPNSDKDTKPRKRGNNVLSPRAGNNKKRAKLMDENGNDTE